MHSFSSVLSLSYIGLLLICMALPTSANADELKVTGRLGLDQEFHDNIFFSPSVQKPEGDALRNLSAVLLFAHRTPRLTDSFQGTVRRLDYRDNNEIDTTDYSMYGNVSYAMSERLMTSAALSSARDSQVSRDITDAGLALGTSTRLAHGCRTDVRYSLSQTISWGFGLNYQRIDYEDKDYVGSRSAGADTAITWRADRYVPRTTFSLQGGYSRYRYLDSILKHTDHESVQATAQWDATERLQVAFNLGGGWSSSYYEYQAIGWKYAYPFGPSYPYVVPYTYTATQTLRSQYTPGSLNVDYRGYRWRMSLSASHDINVGNGTSETTTRDAAGLNLAMDFTPKLSGHYSTAATRNRSHKERSESSAVDQDRYTTRAALHYKLAEHVKLRISQTYDLLKDRENDATYRRHITALGVTIDHSFSY